MSILRWAAIAAALLLPVGAAVSGTGCALVFGIHELTGDAGTDGGTSCNNPAQCDDGNPCTRETCDNGVCGHAPVAKGPAADQAAGDCKTVQCDGEGVASDVNDDQDVVPDMNPCTIDACHDGAATHDNAPDMTACLDGAHSGLCVGGMCAVGCTTDAMCDDMNPCTTDACDGTSSLCVHTTLNAVLTPMAPQPVGDCRTHVCVDGVDTSSPDDSDLPNDGNECHLQQCSMGVPAFPPVGLNAPCGPNKSRFCDGADACVECNEAGQCPGSSDDCKTVTCAAKACGVTFTALNTPVSMQVPHDCHDIVCDGAGNISPTPIANDLDLPDDGNDCTIDVCVAGVPSHSNHKPGDPCGNGAACAAGGVCGCAVDNQCVSPNTCGGGNPGTQFFCGCTLKTCAQVPATCGVVTDGCFSMLACDNGAKDGAETDVDCGGGGACATKCSVSKACVVDSDCGTNHCADGVCCNTACTGTCQACTAAKKGNGSDGMCGSISVNLSDDAPVCSGANACDGNNACKKINGQVCAAGGECVSGSCADGVCCNTACNGACLACNLAGTVGMCSNVASGQTDPVATSPCTGNNACDGAGICRKNNGQLCAANNECLSGACADGFCCNSACTGTCMQCNKAGNLGTCSNIASGQTDTNAAVTCVAPNSCDGLGSCKKSNGQACGANSECVNGACADGYCCNSSCTGTCKACNVAGSLGTCSNIAVGQTDPNAAVTCVAPSSCDGAGNCKKNNGTACGGNSECLSGNCIDGYCCNNSCGATCMSCNVGGSLGTCANVFNNVADGACASCNGAGSCKKTNGTACGAGSECISANCIDGYCCNTGCGAACMSCNIAGSLGACSNVGANVADGACASCDGAGSCKKTNGTLCGGNSECISAECIDGYCCNTACGTTCQSCNIGGSLGTCTNVVVNVSDGACLACDGAGNCKKNNGTACGGGSECVSGNCVDSYCCNTSCTGSCMSCNLAGSLGTCSNVPAGSTDPTASIPCTAPNSCDGAGTCQDPLGTGCGTNAQCQSGFCADGYCCNSACTGTCMQCNLGGIIGTCSNTPQGINNPATCASGVNSCDGSGACKLAFGQPCAGNDSICASGTCKPGTNVCN